MEDKQPIRETVWDKLETEKVARFPFPPHGRIPNFEGATDAADRLTTLDVWKDAKTIKINPDAPQRPVRTRALEAGKRLYMAVPRLAEDKPFIELDPANITNPADASTIGGAAEFGNPAAVESMDQIDMIVTGSVAVAENGVRIGKGEGYSDLEYAILKTAGIVTSATTIVTTIHEHQYWNSEIHAASHDVPMDWIITPTEAVSIDSDLHRPHGIEWEKITDEQRTAIPVLEALRE